MSKICRSRVFRLIGLSKFGMLHGLILLGFLIAFYSCGGNAKTESNDSLRKKGNSGKAKPTVYNKKAVDSLIRAGVISPDSLPDLPPTQAEERKRISKSYDDVKVIDSIFIVGSDTLHFYSKRYCLKNSNIVVPKSYDSERNNPTAFVTHPFATDILLLRDKDTVMNKQFRAGDFNPYYVDKWGGNLKKYGSILDIGLDRRNKDRNRIIVDVSLSIPSTDIGSGVYLIIKKDGSYRI